MTVTKDPRKDPQVIASKTDLAERLQAARASLGLSTRKVAGELPKEFSLSHATIANYERGRTFPSLEVLTALAEMYGRPVDWFFRSSETLQATAFHQRKKVTSAELQQFTVQAQRWLDAYTRLENRLDAPLTGTIEFRSKSQKKKRSPGVLAAALREHLGLGSGAPIASVVELLEAFAIRVIEVEGPPGIEAMAGYFGDQRVFILNTTIPNDRCRMLAVQECGQFLLGHRRNGRQRVSEQKVYEFASHLLLPEPALGKAFASHSLIELLNHKHAFGIPLSAMMLRAAADGLIARKSVRLISRRLANCGWLEREPGMDRPDRAFRFERLVETAMFDQQLKWAELEAITGFSRSELEGRLELALKMLIGCADEIERS